MLSAVLSVEEELRELPISPVMIGILTLAAFIGLLLALLVFGKGRPHS